MEFETVTPTQILSALNAGKKTVTELPLNPRSPRAHLNTQREEILALAAWMETVEASGHGRILDGTLDPRTLTDEERLIVAQHPSVEIANAAIRAIEDPNVLTVMLDTPLPDSALDSIVRNTNARYDVLSRIWRESHHPDTLFSSRIIAHKGMTTRQAFSMVTGTRTTTWSRENLQALCARINEEADAEERASIAMECAAILDFVDVTYMERNILSESVTKMIKQFNDEQLVVLCKNKVDAIRNNALYILATRKPSDDVIAQALTGYVTRPLNPEQKNAHALIAYPDIVTLDLLSKGSASGSAVCRSLAIAHRDATEDEVKAMTARMQPSERESLVNTYGSRSVQIVSVLWRDRSSRVKAEVHNAAIRYHAVAMWNRLTGAQRLDSMMWASNEDFQTVMGLAVADLSEYEYTRGLAAALTRNSRLSGTTVITVINEMLRLDVNEDYVIDLIVRNVTRQSLMRAESEVLIDYLVSHPEARVRLSVATLDSLPIEVAVRLAEDDDEDVRAAVSNVLVTAALL